MIIIASPTADSAAATVKIKSEKSWPYKSSKYTEKIIKFKFKLNNKSSMHINIIKILRRLNTIPTNPTINKKMLDVICSKNIL